MKRLAVTLLVMNSCLALAITSGSKIPLALASLVAVLGFVGERLDIEAKLLTALVLLTGLCTFFFHPPLPRVHGFLFEPGLSFSIGFYSCLGSGLLLMRRNPGWEDLLLLVTTTLAMLVSGNTNVSLPYGYTVVAYVLLLILFLRTRQFGLRASTLGTSVLAMSLAVALGLTFQTNESNFAQMMHSMQFWSASVNFSDVAGIRPQSGPGGTKVMVRVFSQDPSNYFAARRYVLYQNQKWLASRNRTLQAETFEGDPAYILREPLPQDWNPSQIDRVELSTLGPNALLAPLETRAVLVDLQIAQTTECGDLVVSEAGGQFNGSYRVAQGDFAAEEDPDLLRRCLEAQIDPSVSTLAKEIAGDRDDKLKVFALVQFFQQNFEYGFGYPFDKAEDPVATFLRDRPPAHCEVFATSLALMCRSVGVPARYVQGFLVREKNDWGNYWVARERDAHAWVEVYIEGTGWVTVDSTPPGVSEPVEGPSSWSEFADSVKRLGQRAWLLLAQGPTALFKSLLRFLLGHPLGFGMVLVGFLLWRFRSRLPISKTRAKLETKPSHPQILKAQALLQQFEEVIGESQPLGQTLLEWSVGRPEGAAFLEHYSKIRYSTTVPTQQAVEKLGSLLDEVKSKIKSES